MAALASRQQLTNMPVPVNGRSDGRKAMESEDNSVKDIVNSIEQYYSGRPLEEICAERQIDMEVFDFWLATYKQITMEIMELKLQNKQLRKMYVDLVLLNDPKRNG